MHELRANFTHPDQALAGNLQYLYTFVYCIYLPPIIKQK